jgi:hypothetical protein
MTITPGNRCSRRIGNGVLHRIDIDVVIAAAMHLGKPDFLCHIATFLGWLCICIS